MTPNVDSIQPDNGSSTKESRVNTPCGIDTSRFSNAATCVESLESNGFVERRNVSPITFSGSTRDPNSIEATLAISRC